MRSMNMTVFDDTRLDVNGAGQVELTCDAWEWLLQTCGLTVQPRPVVLEPECSVYVNGRFVGGSLAASLDNDSTFNQTMQQGQKIRAVWSGGDAGSIATLTLTGIKTVNP